VIFLEPITQSDAHDIVLALCSDEFRRFMKASEDGMSDYNPVDKKRTGVEKSESPQPKLLP